MRIEEQRDVYQAQHTDAAERITEGQLNKKVYSHMLERSKKEL